jgi:hypothetical protein
MQQTPYVTRRLSLAHAEYRLAIYVVINLFTKNNLMCSWGNLYDDIDFLTLNSFEQVHEKIKLGNHSIYLQLCSSQDQLMSYELTLPFSTFNME